MIQLNFIGRVVADAQVKTTNQGRQYIDMRMAVDMKTGENPETMWVHVRAFNTPVSQAQYYTEGKPLYVTGRYENSIYETKDGRSMISNDVIATSIDFLGLGRDDKQAQPQQQQKQDEAPRNPSTGTEQTEAPEPEPQPKTVAPVADSQVDDLPF